MTKIKLLLILFFLNNDLYANELAYPNKQHLNAQEIVQQSFLVMRALIPKNAISKKHQGKMSRLINRRRGRKASVNQFESYINNNYPKGKIKQKQLAIFRTGKLKGTGILIAHFKDEGRSPLMQIWLPKLRKVRRFSAPQADEFWNGSNLTYGEMFLRKVNDEKHELLSTTTLGFCLKTLKLPKDEQSKATQNLPLGQCAHKGKPVYKIKSTSRLVHWWYDDHISFIDLSTFAVYRTLYYKNNQLIKTVDIDWQSLNQDDPRLIYPAYLYSKSLTDQSESLFIVPRETVYWNLDLKNKFWSESALRKIKR